MRSVAAAFFAVVSVAAVAAAAVGCSPAVTPLPETLSRDFAVQSYQRYASYDEAYMDPDEYLKSFPVSRYKLRDLPGYAKFYLDDLNDVIKNYLRRGEEWEPDIGALIKRHVREGTNVIDVGAHIGTHTILMDKALAGSGTVYAFEPQKKIFVELVVNLNANEAKNVRAMRYAVGGARGIVEMNPAHAGNEGGTQLGKGGDKAALVTIDSLKLTNISFMKIDVEGFEDQVLAGAQNTIRRNRPVLLVEVKGGFDYETAPPRVKARIDHTKDLLGRMGYEVTRVSMHDYLGIPDPAD